MNTLMIVEDEELVRKALVRLVKQSDVKIGTIIECKNGWEALRILKETHVDVVFTDIHMPEMNGCELAAQISGMELPGMHRRPKVVIISSFDNFQCAVEMLKYGAKDYLLKPASKEAVNDVLARMESEIIREDKRLKEIDMIYRQHIRNLLKSGDVENEEAWEILIGVFEKEKTEPGEYRVILTNPSGVRYPLHTYFSLDGVNGDLYVIEEKELPERGMLPASGFCVGISGVHRAMKEIPHAYREALEARKVAFIKESPVEFYGEYSWQEGMAPAMDLDHFLQQFPIGVDPVRKKYQKLCFEAKHQRYSPLKLVEMADDMTKKLQRRYENRFSAQCGGENCPQPLDSIHVEAFLEALDAWTEACGKATVKQTETSKTTDKIQQAILYIQNNYQKNLNLAIVSNHISMNYSMFSHAFRKYTGVNFVNYLKDIRITEAKNLLENTDMKIAEVGGYVGYENDKHFMKTFKAVCGVSPSEYRRQMELRRQRGEPPESEA